MAEPMAEVVRAKLFELVDSEGRVRARLSLDENGTPGLCLCDGEGNVRARLLLTGEGMPQLCSLGQSGVVRAALGFGTEWRAGLVLTDRHGQVVWSAVSHTL